MSLAAGARLGPYEVVGAIGAGGMGEVYRAKDTRLSRDVAVKVLPTSFTDDPDRLRRFEQEARAAGMLNHPNLLAVYDIGTHNGAPYVVSELLEGETRNTVSPDGKWLAASFQGNVRLFAVDGGEPKTVPATERNDLPIRWNRDGTVLYVRNGRLPARVFAVEVASGKRTLLHELAPRDRVGASGIQEIRLTPDGASYAFGYIQTLHNLYQVTGLR